MAGSAGTAVSATTGQTRYRLAGAGLGANAPAVGAADLAVGERADVTAASVQTAGVTDAASIALAARLTIFDLLASGQAFSFVEAPDATVAPAGTALGTNQGAVVYSLAEGASPAAPLRRRPGRRLPHVQRHDRLGERCRARPQHRFRPPGLRLYEHHAGDGRPDDGR